MSEEEKKIASHSEMMRKFKESNQQRIAQLKQLNGAVYLYMAEDGKYCLLKAPDLMILDACKTISGGSSIKFDCALVDNCWIEGDSELKTVDKYRIGLHDWLGGLIKKVDGMLEEL